MFTEAAMKLGGESSNEAKSKSSITLNRALQSAINYLETISKCMVDLNSAVNLVNLINTLNSLQDDVEDKKVTDIGIYYLFSSNNNKGYYIVI